jgi:hypothetical protein
MVGQTLDVLGETTCVQPLDRIDDACVQRTAPVL